MRHYNVKPVSIILEPSYRLLVLLVIISLGVIGVLVSVNVSWWLKLAASVLILITAYYATQRHALLRLVSSCRRIELNAKGELVLTSANGIAQQAEVLPSSFVASYLTVLHLKVAGSRWRRYVVILPDGVDGEQFRRLRVWLRWGSPAGRGTID